MKKFIAILCAAAMVLTLAACGAKRNTEYAGQTVTGKVTAIDGTSVTLALGESSGSGAPSGGDGQQPPEMPDGSSQTDGQPTGMPPEKPDGSDDSGQSGGQEPPAKPDGDSSQQPTGTPPEKPDGDSDQQGGTPPEMPDGSSQQGGFTESGETVTVDISKATVTKNGESASASDLAAGDVVQVTFDKKGVATAVVIGSQSGFGGSGTVTQGSSANTISEDGTYSKETYTSTGDDENALRVDGATVTLDGITVDKSGGATSNTENGDFYGVNAALLATGGATVTIKNATVTSSAQNGNGVFSYGSGTTVNISDSTITTTADNSGGLQTTGGGTTNATNLTVETNGNSSAAIRSDRGGGTVNVEKGTYTSKGYNSPAVYSTANITVKNAALTAENSEALVVEGKNSITLENCDVSGSMSDSKGTSSSENVHNVMIYQSMSGDAETGTANFSMTGGKLTSSNGDQFYVTNTDCNITLSGVTLVNKDKNGKLLRVTGNSASHGWGTAGKNGAQVTFTADAQTMEGDMEADSISTLDLTLKNNSTFTGTIQIVDNADGGTAVENNAVVTIEKGSKWVLTGDCTITSLTNNGTIDFNGHTITLADGTVLKG